MLLTFLAQLKQMMGKAYIFKFPTPLFKLNAILVVAQVQFFVSPIHFQWENPIGCGQPSLFAIKHVPTKKKDLAMERKMVEILSNII